MILKTMEANGFTLDMVVRDSGETLSLERWQLYGNLNNKSSVLSRRKASSRQELVYFQLTEREPVCPEL